MTSYREQSLQAKAVREGIVEPRPLGTKNARARPVVVEYRKHPGYRGALLVFLTRNNDWRKWGAYRNEPEALAMIRTAERKHAYYEFRVRAAASLSKEAE